MKLFVHKLNSVTDQHSDAEISTTSLKSSESYDVLMGFPFVQNVAGDLQESCICLRIFRRTSKYCGQCLIFSEPY